MTVSRFFLRQPLPSAPQLTIDRADMLHLSALLLNRGLNSTLFHVSFLFYSVSQPGEGLLAVQQST